MSAVRKALSYACGVSAKPLTGKTIGRAFDDTVARLPNHTAIVSRHEGLKLAYAEFARQVDRAAASFLKLGLKRGDTVGILAMTSSEWTVVQMGAAKCGIRLLAMNPAFRAHEISYGLNKVEAKALITTSSFKSSDFDGILRSILPELNDHSNLSQPLKAKGCPTLEHVITLGAAQQGDGFANNHASKAHPSTVGNHPGMHRWADFLGLASESDINEMQRLSDTELDGDDIVSLQLTSGTTGLPKAVGLSHANVLNNAIIVGDNQGLTESDKVLGNPPLFHCMGQVMSSLASFERGATILFGAPAFDPAAALHVAADHGATSVMGVPTMFLAMLSHASEPKLRDQLASTLRTGVMAGSVCPIELMRQVERQWKLKELTICYGMTETSPVSTQTARDDPEDLRTQTVGRVCPHTEVKIVDPATGKIVPRGTPGELMSRGYLVMRGGYINDEAKTKEAIKNGWMATGDQATMDDNGYIRIVGRIKDLIIRGGENVGPREVEDFLFTHPAVQDVTCFGVADEKFGEEIAVAIVLKNGYEAATDEDEQGNKLEHHGRKGHHHDHGPIDFAATKVVGPSNIKAFCKGTIAHYKVPRYVSFVADFPKTGSGKIQKFVLRDETEKRLGLKKQK